MGNEFGKKGGLGMTNRLHWIGKGEMVAALMLHQLNFEQNLHFIPLSCKQSILHFQAICSKIGSNPQIDFVARCNCL